MRKPAPSFASTVPQQQTSGIGCRHGARPEITGNECIANGAAGIGVEHGEVTKIEGNLCWDNKASGIGICHHAEAILGNNRLLDKAFVAIGVRNESKLTAEKNTLFRKGGMPLWSRHWTTRRPPSPTTTWVAGLLLQGTADIRNNLFHRNDPCKGGPPNFAV